MFKNSINNNLLLLQIVTVLFISGVFGREWIVAPQGSPLGSGTSGAPLDIVSVFKGDHSVMPGDTILLQGGTYKAPNRSSDHQYLFLSLKGQDGNPIVIKPADGQRATIDGYSLFVKFSEYVWVWDLELTVSENTYMTRTMNRPMDRGQEVQWPEGLERPYGGLWMRESNNCKYINLVIHHCTTVGIGFWQEAIDSEIYGCIIYENGYWGSNGDGDGHAIYSSNNTGGKIVSNCIFTKQVGYGLHIYGSGVNQQLKNYLVKNNISYNNNRDFLVGGHNPAKSIYIYDNYLFDDDMVVGYLWGPENEDCYVNNNIMLNGKLTFHQWQQINQSENIVYPDVDAISTSEPFTAILLENAYDSSRAHVAIYNWKRIMRINFNPGEFLQPGERYQLIRPAEYYESDYQQGTYDGLTIPINSNSYFEAFVLLKEGGIIDNSGGGSEESEEFFNFVKNNKTSTSTTNTNQPRIPESSDSTSSSNYRQSSGGLSGSSSNAGWGSSRDVKVKIDEIETLDIDKIFFPEMQELELEEEKIEEPQSVQINAAKP